MTYGVYLAAKKLKHYFQEHDMRVVAKAPISEIIGNKDASGRIAKWAIELAPYTSSYERRDAVKSQALADFLVDWAETQYEPPPPDANYWRMHFDGSKAIDGCGAIEMHPPIISIRWWRLILSLGPIHEEISQFL